MDMSHWRRLRRAALACGLGVAVLGTLVLWAMSTQVARAGAAPVEAEGIAGAPARPLAASIIITKTVGTEPGVCAATQAITVAPNTSVTYCFTAFNNGTITLTLHTLTDNRLGTIYFNHSHALAPGASMFVTRTALLTQSVTNEATWIASDGGSNFPSDLDSATVNVVPPSIALAKTVGTNPSVCAATDEIAIQGDVDATYCYRVTNTGPFTLAAHTLVDDQLGAILTDYAYPLGPGASFFVTQTVYISETIVNTAVWTATDSLDNEAVSDDTAQVTIYAGLPVSLIHAPENGAVITDKGVLNITGVAWDAMMIPRPFPEEPLLQPINNPTGGGNYMVDWNDVVSATFYVLEEASNPDFDGATSIGEVNSDHLFVSQGTGTYYYRVKAYNGAGRSSRWSNVEQTTVTSGGAYYPRVATGALSAPAAPAQVTASGPVTVWVRIDGGVWQTATTTADAGGWWNWSYGWSMPEEENVQHVIQTQARDAIDNLSPVDAITVTLDNHYHLIYFPLMFKRWPPIPYPPTLNDITDPENDGTYTVSWSYSYPITYPQPVSYTLQEATDSGFTSGLVEYAVSGTSKQISKTGGGTFYYRVRGNNAYGAGEWSAVDSISVGYRDDFNGATTWDWRRGDDIIAKASSFRIRYSGGSMYTLIVGSYDFGVVSPMKAAASVPYTLRARVSVVKNESFDGRTYYIRNGTMYGLVFGGNSGSPCPADRNTATNTGCFSHYYRLTVIYDVHSLGAPFWQLKRIDYHDHDDDGKGKGVTLIQGNSTAISADGWNEWRVEVSSSAIKVYVNGTYLGQTNDTRYVNDRYFGIFLGSPDIGDTGIKWDWYEVK